MKKQLLKDTCKTTRERNLFIHVEKGRKKKKKEGETTCA